jgi:hypothetical protein
VTLTFTHVLVGALIAVTLVLHYYVRQRRRELEAKVGQLESFNAALGLRLLHALDLVKKIGFVPAADLQREVDELKESVYQLFRDYRGGVVLQALGDVTVTGDVVGGDKSEVRSPKSEVRRQ